MASTPADLAHGLEKLRTAIENGKTEINAEQGVCFSAEPTRPRLGFLFPGQGSPSHVNGGVLRRRFQSVADIYARAQLDQQDNETVTIVAQPAIVTASISSPDAPEDFEYWRRSRRRSQPWRIDRIALGRPRLMSNPFCGSPKLEGRR